MIGRHILYEPDWAVSSSFSCAESTRTTGCTEFVAGDICNPWPKPSMQGIAGEVRPLTLYQKIVGCCWGAFIEDVPITSNSSVFYSSSNPAVATVSNGLFTKGQVTFQGPGVCEIRAEYQGQQHVCETFCGVGGLATARTKVDRTGMNGPPDPVNFILPGGCQICQTFPTTFTAVITVTVTAGASVTITGPSSVNIGEPVVRITASTNPPGGMLTSWRVTTGDPSCVFLNQIGQFRAYAPGTVGIRVDYTVNGQTVTSNELTITANAVAQLFWDHQTG